MIYILTISTVYLASAIFLAYVFRTEPHTPSEPMPENIEVFTFFLQRALPNKIGDAPAIISTMSVKGVTDDPFQLKKQLERLYSGWSVVFFESETDQEYKERLIDHVKKHIRND